MQEGAGKVEKGRMQSPDAGRTRSGLHRERKSSPTGGREGNVKELTPAEIEIMRQARQAVAMGGRAAELMNLARFADDNGLRACGRALRNIAGAFADKADEIRKQNKEDR